MVKVLSVEELKTLIKKWDSGIGIMNMPIKVFVNIFYISPKQNSKDSSPNKLHVRDI